MINSSYSFVDVETTGGNALKNRIIEIGIVRVENFKVVATYKSLINPQAHLDPFITQLTGITSTELENAPTFASIKKDILELLVDSTFVAHNARFDYSFLRQEFKREDITFSLKQLCTVKLARALFPGFNSYNLDSIIERHNIPCKSRHRAFDDAQVLWEFIKTAKKELGKERLEQAIHQGLKRPSLPVQLSQDMLDSLPENPGVYIFKNKEGAVLYVGKSINIRDRVLSHFANDYASGTDMMLSKEAHSIDYIETSGELGALLLESTLIKKLQPLYNRMLRYARKLLVLERVLLDSGYTGVNTKEVSKIDISDSLNIVGIFRSRREISDFLYKTSHEYSLCPRLLGVEKGKKACFSYHLGKCRGACINKELPVAYNIRFEQAFYKKKIQRWKFEGPIVIKDGDEGFVVDKWCVLGKLDVNRTMSDLSDDYVFDLDSYKILQRFLNKDHNLKYISELKSSSIHSSVLQE